MPSTTPQKPKAVVAWSSGKDSAYALYLTRQSGRFDIVGTITTLTDPFDRVSTHGVREVLLDLQSVALGLPSTKVRIPSPCTNAVYEERMAEAFVRLRDEQGVTHVIFGDLFLEDIRKYRERQLAAVGLTGVFPLWKMETHELAQTIQESGVEAILTCIDPKVLPAFFAGSFFDLELLASLPLAVDPCGENGEFHTFVIGGPMFTHRLQAVVGETVERGGFVFADVLPGSAEQP